MKTTKWLISKQIDILVMLIPVWVCWLIAFLLPEIQLHSAIPLWVFVVVVIGIDVSHVWSSIFRTYLDKEEFKAHRKTLIFAPIISFAFAFSLSAISIDLFWRYLAYLAVYHFIKQQFGFMRIYKAKNGDFRPKLIRDNFVVYLAMIYPIIYWHLATDREFAWFMDGDFLSANLGSGIMQWVGWIGNSLYFLILGWWFVEELNARRKKGVFQLGKVLWVLTTAINWFIGIIYFNSDLVFTVTNVVAHGLPYLALIIFYQGGKLRFKLGQVKAGKWFKIGGSIIATVIVLAIAEEYLWDMLVYRENESLFTLMGHYPIETPGYFIQLLAIGFLAVPQITHYILDGYIWKNNEKNPHLKEILLK